MPASSPSVYTRGSHLHHAMNATAVSLSGMTGPNAQSLVEQYITQSPYSLSSRILMPIGNLLWRILFCVHHVIGEMVSPSANFFGTHITLHR